MVKNDVSSTFFQILFLRFHASKQYYVSWIKYVDRVCFKHCSTWLPAFKCNETFIDLIKIAVLSCKRYLGLRLRTCFTVRGVPISPALRRKIHLEKASNLRQSDIFIESSWKLLT